MGNPNPFTKLVFTGTGQNPKPAFFIDDYSNVYDRICSDRGTRHPALRPNLSKERACSNDNSSSK